MSDEPELHPASPAPDPNATGTDAALPSSGGAAPDHGVRGRETMEREAAWRRGRERRHTGAEIHEGEIPPADRELTHLAFTALAENVRDYAVFLMNPDGVIRYWGEGAHLMKRWTREQAEGGHLRLLYPDGGAEDGTAEDHLRESAEHGESVSQGHRVRGDGTTFWAHITLTALKADDGTLLGFAKVTRDITARHAAEAALARSAQALELEAVRAERADLLAEVAVLKEELGVLNRELRGGGGEARSASPEP